MRVVIFFLSVYTFLLGYGHTCYSEAQQHTGIYLSSERLETELSPVFLDSDDLHSLWIYTFSNIVEENVLEEEDDDDNSNDKVFSENFNVQNSFCSFSPTHFFTTRRSVPHFFYAGTSTPIYLSNRVLRI